MTKTVSLTLKDCDESFAFAVESIYNAYKKKIKFGVEMNFSGGEKFNVKYKDIDPLRLYDIVLTSHKPDKL